ncbi:MAG: Flp family type IVb pilin [Alphaproteobacteria bacterium]|nr:Flp family type IVb pilin [Alphaproteobacteria bacterium]
MSRTLLRLLRREGGATAIEYALVGVLISIAAFSVIMQTGSSVTGLFTHIANSF